MPPPRRPASRAPASRDARPRDAHHHDEPPRDVGRDRPRGRTRAWWLLRAWLNLLPTAAALAWGVAHGGRPVLGRDLVVECGGMRRGYARGGTTVGNVWLHGGLGGPHRRRHEARHADQWAVLGPVLMPLLYGLEAALTRGDPLRSRFERHAGLEDGGYAPPGADGRPTPDEVRPARAPRR